MRLSNAVHYSLDGAASLLRVVTVAFTLLVHPALRHTRIRPSAEYADQLRAQLQLMITRVTNDEYDLALAHTPDLCRPFAAALGDRRPAAAVLAAFPAAAATPLSSLAETLDGRRAAEALAGAIRGRLAGLVGVGRRAVTLEDGSVL